MSDPVRIIETKTESAGTSTLAFIIGGLVVAVAVIAWFIYGGDITPKSGGDAGNTSISIDNAAPAPAPAAPAEPAPAAPKP
ncbi:MAG: hypothetical protein ACOH2H_08215 [Cypionkella sp.]